MAGGSEMGMKSETASCMEEKEFIIEEWRAAILFLRMSPSTQSRSTGKERDPETGLDYFGARYYASNLGRWLSPDWAAAPVTVPYAKFGDPQSLNLYSYVENAPINNADADGHFWLFFGMTGDASGTKAKCAGNSPCKGPQPGKQAAQTTIQQNQSQTAQNNVPAAPDVNNLPVSTASVGVMALPLLARAGVGAMEGAEGGGAAGTVEPGPGNVVGAVTGAVIGTVVAVAAPQVYERSKVEAGKAWTKFKTGLEHLGKTKLGGPDQDPRRGWKVRVRRVANEMDEHADRMTGHQGTANAIHFAADLIRGLIPGDPI